MSVPDHPIVSAYLNQIRPSTCAIFAQELACEGSAERFLGSGVIVGLVDQKGARADRLLVATSAHVIEFDQDEEIKWTIHRYGSNGLVSYSWASPRSDGTDRDWYKGDWYENRSQASSTPNARPSFDVGMLRCPIDDVNHEFFRNITFPAMTNVSTIAEAGTRVGWCGFPQVAYNAYKRLIPCYYEGVVSWVWNEDGKPPIYLLDGHNSTGVSGGPMWCYFEDQQQVAVAGVITHYRPGDKFDHRPNESFPGFVEASAINPLRSRVEELCGGRIVFKDGLQ